MQIIDNFKPQEVVDNFSGIILLPDGTKSFFWEGEFVFDNKHLFIAPYIKYLESSHSIIPFI